MTPAPPTEESLPAPPGAAWWHRWALLVLRLVIIAAVAWTAIQIPLPVMDHWLSLRDVVVTLTAIILAGKTLFDTLFYDHYWP